MDYSKINILNSSRDLIVNDLHGDVIESLKNQGVLDVSEYESINSLDKQDKRNKRFLDVLVNKSDGLEKLLEALKVWYSWIYEDLTKSLINSKKWEDVIPHSVPALPLRNVSRTALLNDVRTALKELKRGDYVVLHGMSGCGKSTLAAEALYHPILIEQFDGKVYWLSCGQDTKSGDDNDILGLLVELNEEIWDEELVSDMKTATLKALMNKLTKRYEASTFREGLVVLDDVNSAQVIDALRIGCKTLVTTNDINVMKNQGNRYKQIQVSEGFTEEESLKQLAECVGLSVEQLPYHALEIHLNSKGYPLIMSLIGGQLESHQEEARSNSESWKPYLDVLVTKDYRNLNRRSYEANSFFPKTIELCLNNLSQDLREKYQDFALFVEDVNIKTEVLQMLWDLPCLDVRQIMDEFHKKSLIVRKYNATGNCYVYGIHDILLHYLKKQLNDEALKELHKKLIERYRTVSKNDPALLPKNDNYFFYYVGYHIANSAEYKLFPLWYFNLDFIEAKLKVAGPGDLLSDYKRYGSHFTPDSVDPVAICKSANYLADFVRFVEASGVDVRRNHGPDIVQLALQEPHESHVYKIALQVAHSRPSSTYLRFQLGPSKSRSIPHQIPTKEKVTFACFSKDSNELIVGFESGIIQMITRKGYVTRVYEGHSEKVTRLSLSSPKNIFLSVSGECVKIWKLPELDSSTHSGSGNRTPSPSQRQDYFTNIFNLKTVDKRMSWLTIDKCVDGLKGQIEWANFSTDGSKMAFCMKKGKVEVRGINENLPAISSIKAFATTCVFSHNNELLIIGCSTSYILVHNIITNTALRNLVDSYPILDVFTLPGNDEEMKFATLTKATISVWGLENVTADSATQKKTNIPCPRDYNIGKQETYVCCAAASDGSYVAVATSSGKILICDVSDGSKIWEMDHVSGNIKYLAMDESKDHMLLGCCDDAIRIWTLGEVHSAKCTTMKTNFEVAWTSNCVPILVAPTYKNCVKKVFEQNKTEDLPIPVTSKCEINICAISKCGIYITTGAYITTGTSSGEVYLHVCNSESNMTKILTVNKCINKLKVEVINEMIFVVAGLDRTVEVWACKEEDILQMDRANKFTLKLNDRLVECFILQNEKIMTVLQNGSIKKWSLTTGKLLEVLCQARLDVEVCDAALSCKNEVVTLDCRRSLINFYNFETEKEKQHKADYPPTCCSFSTDGKKLVVGFKNGLIQIWDCGVKDFKPLKLTLLSDQIETVCVSGAGLVGAATKSQVVLVTEEGGEGRAKLRVQRLVMSPDNHTVLTVDTDGHMHLIDHFDNKSIPSLEKPPRVFAKLSLKTT